MDLTKLTRASHRRDTPDVPLLGQFTLAGARAHELCGSVRRRLALWVARETQGPILWLRPHWHPDALHMAGVARDIPPGRLIFVEVDRAEDLLWSMEEALRSGTVSLVVADLPDPPGLTPVRRLHLAAEAGMEAQGRPPLGLLLTPGAGGAPGVESRWQLEPAHQTTGPAWQLTRLRARQAPPGVWRVARDAEGRLRLSTEPQAEPAPA